MNHRGRDASIYPGPAQGVWEDARGNRIAAATWPGHRLEVDFRGHGCLLEIDPAARLGQLRIEFHGSDALCRIGAVGTATNLFRANVRLGQDCSVVIGDDVTTTDSCFIAASESCSVTIGDDCMLATGVQLRTDDAHPIFDVRTGERINPARDIVIGSHVWLAYGVRCLGGSRVGDGSVVGMGVLVTGAIPNNCVAAGVPARVSRHDIAWERTLLSLPSAVPAADRHWNLTRSEPAECT